MKIIVTGGAGFIGGNFVHHMVNKYPEYHDHQPGSSDLCGQIWKHLKAGGGQAQLQVCTRRYRRPSRLSLDLFEKEKPDVVVNFAAESHVDRSITDPEAFVRTNVMGTTTLLDACRTYGIKALSSGIYR